MLKEEGNSEKRKFPRIPFREAVEYNMRDNNNFGGCLAYDLSTGGMRINFNDFVPSQTKISVRVSLGQPVNMVVDLVGRVVWIQQISHSERYHLGLEFTDTDGLRKSQEDIASYVHSYSL